MVEQLKLFDVPASYRVQREPTLNFDRPGLETWQKNIHRYQQSQRQINQPQQTALFDLPATSWHQPDDIDPFTLPQQTALFWRQGNKLEAIDDSNQGCLYFILDRRWPLLLYVGETKLSADRRWQGSHDCKDYILNYIELHRRYDYPVEVVAAFWPHLPPEKKTLQAWEKQLILKWRSPFNKECWRWWGQPFGKS
ncbi:MAG: GIY-YIG nuclease family protein [Synechocystis sp.]